MMKMIMIVLKVSKHDNEKNLKDPVQIVCHC